MKPQRASRRWFLRGLAGASLAIPPLPSLLPQRQARAATPGRQIFIGIMSAYGGVWARNMFPQMPASAEVMSYAGRKIRRAALEATSAGGETKLSEVLSAPSGSFSKTLAGKMTLLQGIDLPFDTNHHISATFGCYAQGDGKVGKSGARWNATVDQVIAQSPAFYRDTTGVTQRSVLFSHFGALSYRNKVAGNPTSGIDAPPTYMQPDALWTALFGGAKPSTAQPRKSVVDLVLEDYKRTLANPRLSTLDKERLQDHIERIADIQRRESVTIACTPPARPANAGDPGRTNDWSVHASFYVSFQDTLVAALACGLTRVAAVLHQGWSTTFGDRTQDPWHQQISHEVDKAGPQSTMATAMKRQFSNVVLPLVNKLDAIKDETGTSLLDRSLVYWTQEHGTFSHCQENIPVVTFGSADGAFKTGSHMDYRDLTRYIDKGQFGDTGPDRSYVGLTWHQMLATLVKGFQIPKSEWAEPNHGGFGVKPDNLGAASYNNRANLWGSNEWNAAGDDLPWWRA